MTAPFLDRDATAMVERHLRVGWLALLAFAAIGIGLETLHGFKVAAYVNVANETRRLMWTLAHADGALLGLVNIAFATTVRLRLGRARTDSRLASRCLLGATAAIPAGFFLGGCFTYDGDPGLGILLVPDGGLLLLIALGSMALPIRRTSTHCPATDTVPDAAERMVEALRRRDVTGAAGQRAAGAGASQKDT